MGVDSNFDRAKSQYINGAWHVGQGELKLQVIDPSTDTLLANLGTASPNDVGEAAAAAHQAYPPWRALPSETRAQYLQAMALGLKNRETDLVTLQMTNNGKPKRKPKLTFQTGLRPSNTMHNSHLGSISNRARSSIWPTPRTWANRDLSRWGRWD